MSLIEFHCGDCRSTLRSLPENSIHCAVTSPPYYGLRDYKLEPLIWDVSSGCEHEWGDSLRTVIGGGLNKDFNSRWGQGSGQAKQEAAPRQKVSAGAFCIHCGAWRGCLGLEPAINLYVEHLVQVCRELRRALRPDGVFWLNIGDSYNAYNGNRGRSKSFQAATDQALPDLPGGYGLTEKHLKPKDLIGVPWRVALALQEDGWYLRSDVIWFKPNVLPESVRDRPTRAHEYLFMLTKQPHYFYDADAIREPHAKPRKSGPNALRGQRELRPRGNGQSIDEQSYHPGGRNRRSVWEIATKPFPDTHFAVFPEKLVEPCLLAGTSEYGACPNCWAPFRRIIQKGAPLEEWKRSCGADSAGGYQGQAQKEYEAHGAQNASATKSRILAGMVERRTVGWQPTCRCSELPPLCIVDAVARILNPERARLATVPCVTLDPFAGSGTVGVVAKRLGLRAILVDQSAAYIEMARRRCGEETDAPTAVQHQPDGASVESGVP